MIVILKNKSVRIYVNIGQNIRERIKAHSFKCMLSDCAFYEYILLVKSFIYLLIYVTYTIYLIIYTI